MAQYPKENYTLELVYAINYLLPEKTNDGFRIHESALYKDFPLPSIGSIQKEINKNILNVLKPDRYLIELKNLLPLIYDIDFVKSLKMLKYKAEYSFKFIQNHYKLIKFNFQTRKYELAKFNKSLKAVKNDKDIVIEKFLQPIYESLILPDLTDYKSINSDFTDVVDYYRGRCENFINSKHTFIKNINNLLQLIESVKSLLVDVESNYKASNSVEKKGEIISSSRPLKFNDLEIRDKTYQSLKMYFPGQENELKEVLEGNTIKKPLLFTQKQNQLIEVFIRLQRNKYISNGNTDIKNFLCLNFQYTYSKGNISQIRQINETTCWDVLNGRGRPKGNKFTLSSFDWLPFK